MKYLVVNYEDEEFGAFDTRAEAKEHIKELKRFDKENKNPFDEGYRVLLINDDNEPVCYCP